MPRSDDPFDGSFDGSFDEGDDDAFGSGPSRMVPPSPDDRLWRHPSEMGQVGAARPLTVVARPSRASHTWLVAFMAALAGSSITLATVLALGAFRTTTAPPAGVERVSAETDQDPAAPIIAAQKVLPAIGRIQVRTATDSVTGTAVVFRSDGHLMTTADLVDGAEEITVSFSGGEPMPAALVGTDRESDIAVLKVEAGTMPVAVLGRSANVRLGDPVIAIDSSPFGTGPPAIPVGVVNALGRRVETDNPIDVALYDMVQTNLELTSTATGAPLIDARGSVIGVITSRGYRAPSLPAGSDPAMVASTARRGTGPDDELIVRFATPIDYARKVADSLIRPGGKVEHAYLGAVGEALTPDAARRLDIPGGLTLTNIAEDSPAATGPTRLQVGDVLVRFQDDPVTSWDDLVVALRKQRPGDTISVMFHRSGATEPDAAIFILGDRPTAAG